MHQVTTDRICVNWGKMSIALYDGRSESRTWRTINTFVGGEARQGLLIVPPGVWHAVKNVDSTPAALLNMVDRAYDYENPDHWRLPHNTDKIPYSFDS